MNSDNYIFVADSHVRENMTDDFFAMLDRIRQYRPAGVIFLGDIFELWIALKGYESDMHFRFLDWCRESKKLFEVGFITGNHEFYVLRNHADAFSWITETEHTLKDGIRLMHGDLVNRADKWYLVLRKFLRHPVVRFLLKLTSGNIGPKIANFVLVSLKKVNLQYKCSLPMPYLEKYSRDAVSENIRYIYAGHFHHYNKLSFSGGVPIEILPTWNTAGEIGLLKPGLKSECRPWKDLLPAVGSDN